MNTSKRKFIKSSLLSGLGLSMIHQNIFASLLSQDVPYKMLPLRNNVGYFTERGGTIGWMISKEGIVVVDTQFPEQSQHLIQAIKSQSDRKIDLLINTHHHGDHSGGNIEYKEIANMVLAHENSKKNQIRVAKESGKEATQLYPDTTFKKDWSKKIGDEIITLTYFGPAHTDGDSITHFENANIAHMGDLIFNRRFPYIDKSAGASVQNWINVLENAQKIYDNDTKFIFGHSDNGFDIVGTKKDIAAFQNYLSKLMEKVQSDISDGVSEDEIMKIQSIEGAEEWKGNNMKRSLSAVYQELTS